MEVPWQGRTSLKKKETGHVTEFFCYRARGFVRIYLPLVLWNRKVFTSVECSQKTQGKFNSKLFLHSVACQAPLGMESGAIGDSQISASTTYAPSYAAQQARLHFKAGGVKTGGWSVKVNDLNQWLQVDLQTKTRVTRIATQGRNAEYNQWVTKYKLQHGEDKNTLQFYRQNGDHSDTVSLLL